VKILFRPELIGEEYGGVHDCLSQAVMRADMDMRRTLFSQVSEKFMSRTIITERYWLKFKKKVKSINSISNTNHSSDLSSKLKKK
jgi:hypothetical protein